MSTKIHEKTHEALVAEGSMSYHIMCTITSISYCEYFMLFISMCIYTLQILMNAKLVHTIAKMGHSVIIPWDPTSV